MVCCGGKAQCWRHSGSNKLSQVWLKMVKLFLCTENTEVALNTMTGVCCMFFLSLRTQHVNSFGLGGFIFLYMGCLICLLFVSDVEANVETVNAQVSKLN